MRRAVALAALTLTAGCGKFRDLREAIEAATHPIVVQAMFLGVAPPESDLVMLDDTEFASGSAIRVFLADAAGGGLGAPLRDGSVQVRVGGVPSVDLAEADPGAYQATAEEGLVYDAGVEAAVSVASGEHVGRLYVGLPGPAAPGVDFEHSPGEPLALDLTDYSYQSALAVVIDVTSGEIVWSNEPTDIDTLYDMTHGDGIKRLEIPGQALATESVFAVGLAGMMASGEDDIEDVNTALSAFLAGELVFEPVCTMGALCAEVTPEMLQEL